MTFIKCYACKHKFPQHSSYRFMYNSRQVLIFECPRCGSVFHEYSLNDQSSYDQFYGKDYISWEKSGSSFHDPDLTLSSRSKKKLGFNLFNTRFFPNHHNFSLSRAVEFGPGNGDYAFHLSKLFSCVSIVDPSSYVAQQHWPKNVKVYQEPISSFDTHPHKYNFVAAFMMLEHDVNIKNNLNALSKLMLNQDSLFVGSIPVCNGISFKTFHQFWYDLHYPQHQLLLTESKFRQLLNEANFEIIHLRYHRTFSHIIGSLLRVTSFAGAKLLNLSFQYNYQEPKVHAFDKFINIVFLPLSYLLAYLKLTGRITFVCTIKP